MNTNEIEILSFSSAYRENFKQLNYTWIKKFFALEPEDEYVLSFPEEAIIDKGGYIYFARFQGEIVGTVSLSRIDEETLELGKMAVLEVYQNGGLGKLLMQAALAKGKSLQVKRIILFSNTGLCTAVNMYISFGFRVIPNNESHFIRSNIKMELKLN